MGIKVTIPNTSSDTLTFGSANTTTAAQIAGIDSGSTNGQLAIYTTASGTSTERVRVDSSGNVGIGTASPTVRLQVVTATTGNVTAATWSDNVTDTGYLGIRSGGGVGLWAGGFLAFGSGSGTFTERMRIDSSGNLLVGTTSVAASCKTTIATSSNNQLAIDCTTGTGTVYSTIVFSQSQTTKTQLYQDHGATRFYIVNNTNGLYLAANATAWTAVSDERAKENLVPITNAASKVASLRAVTGNYISDESKKSRAFLIAQDVQSVLPEAVDSSDSENLGVQYTDVIPLLVAAIKEQQALIQTLTDRITALENK